MEYHTGCEDRVDVDLHVNEEVLEHALLLTAVSCVSVKILEISRTGAEVLITMPAIAKPWVKHQSTSGVLITVNG